MQILLHGILGETVADSKYPDRFLLRIHSSGKKEQDAETYTKTYNDKLLESARKLKEAGITEKTDKENSKGTRLDYAAELADARLLSV